MIEEEYCCYCLLECGLGMMASLDIHFIYFISARHIRSQDMKYIGMKAQMDAKKAEKVLNRY
tara:strand:+ start:521 stop:706 length:186 start_codon:yes stop_codon:yes gene_type:complete